MDFLGRKFVLKENLKGCFPKCGKASLCENYCGADGYCCSGENPADPNSWLVKNGGNGDCPAEALAALRNRKGGIEPGFMCVKEVLPEEAEGENYILKRIKSVLAFLSGYSDHLK